jgi:hypothetical protein
VNRFHEIIPTEDGDITVDLRSVSAITKLPGDVVRVHFNGTWVRHAPDTVDGLLHRWLIARND